jgi:site-specific recombinase XerD
VQQWGSVQSGYRTYLKGRGLSPASLRAYLSDARQLVAELSGKALTPDQLDGQIVGDACHAILHERRPHLPEYSPRTVSRKTSSLNRFMEYLIEVDVLCDRVRLNPGIHRPARSGNRKMLSMEDVVRVLEQPEGRSLMGIRDAAMLALVVFGGFRSREIARLDLPDVKINAGRISLHSSPNERLVYLPSVGLQTLRRWLGLRSMFARST